MLTKLEKLESQQAEVRARISPTSFEQWLHSNVTKALKLQLDIDLEELKDNWASSRYDQIDTEAKARGKAEYIEGLYELIPLIRGEDND